MIYTASYIFEHSLYYDLFMVGMGLVAALFWVSIFSVFRW